MKIIKKGSLELDGYLFVLTHKMYKTSPSTNKKPINQQYL